MLVTTVAKSLLFVCSKVVELVRGPATITASLCILRHEDDVLFVRHTYRDHRVWQFPGGSSKPDELAPATACREIGEELSVELRQSDLQYLGEFLIPNCRLHFFIATVASTDFTKDDREIAEAKWFSLSHPPRRIGPAARTALDRLRHM
jgi:8-oxo-dGTP pyrophosphatase MutT (NUDIX family)